LEVKMTATVGVILSRVSIDDHEGEVTVRGLLDIRSFEEGLIREGEYQREVLPVSDLDDWIESLKKGKVPDIDLGMRGANFENIGDSTILLQDPVYVIDGLQRISAARTILADEDNDVTPHLWAVLHFNTTEESERKRFRLLNTKRRKVSGNKIAANMRQDYPIVQALYDLTVPSEEEAVPLDEESGEKKSSFVLMGRVTWGHRRREGDLLSAASLLKVLGDLHGHRGSTKYTTVVPLIKGLQELADVLTVELLIENLKYLFELADQMWQFGRLGFHDRSALNSQAFLTALARLYSMHTDFWKDDDTLFVKAAERERLASFPVHDPTMLRKAKSGGTAGRDGMIDDLVAHINYKRTTNRLKERPL
jgi:hypothetical protein